MPNIQDQKRNTPGNIINKMLNIYNKERILKAARGKQKVTYKGKSRTEHFETEILNMRRAWDNIFQSLKKKSVNLD
jgi:hypothetical protein